MNYLLNPPSEKDFPTLAHWLNHAELSPRIVVDKYAERDCLVLIIITIQENVLTQLENLRSHQVIAMCLAEDKINLFGWVCKIEACEVLGRDPDNEQLLVLNQQPARSKKSQAFLPLSTFGHQQAKLPHDLQDIHEPE